ncbi:MAG TPA: class I adenylate-forming enzyme family protein, partial [Aminobacteriaceae bacterium]|nr:class I adenylate-forming enzyme family protein [Aminobacteriaceae bacterium]
MPNSWIGNYSFFRARIDSSREAVYDLDTETRYTYGDLERRANLLARYLKDQAGVRKGDRVAFIARNCIEMIDAYYATGKLGAIFVPYNARLSVSELVQLVNNETPKVLFYEEVFADKIPHLKSGCSVEKYLVLSPGKNPENDTTYAEATGHGNDAFVGCDELDIEDIHMIIHTGGTTGLPKGGLISHRCELFN